MTPRVQALVLVLFILVSLALTQIPSRLTVSVGAPVATGETTTSIPIPPALSFEKASLEPAVVAASGLPARNWKVLDPAVDAKAVLAESLDEDFQLLRLGPYTLWPIASLTKLMTAVVVLEDAGADKKVTVNADALQSPGDLGQLVAGETYSAQDLLRVMLLASSNDAAAAFEDYFGGADALAARMNNKAKELGMDHTSYHDGSGLSPQNQGTIDDLFVLTKYILEHHPEIFAWTRLPSILVQPLDGTAVKTIPNIDPLAARADFLGGKTGTLPEADQNLIAIFQLHDLRVVLIILGSSDRVKAATQVLQWMENAYTF